MNNIHQTGEIISVNLNNNKKNYHIISILGQGGVGVTYLAIDLEKSEKVAIKVLSLRHMNDWKQIEMFEREAKILSQLNHPAIPRYLNYFKIETSQDIRFYIVQNLADGKSLATLIQNGWQPDEIEVKQIAIQLLEILTYLHSLTPPVIHRDIKPQNIIRSNDGKIYLVDFGAVQDTYHNTVTRGSTVVGTYGYMAPEQFRGQAVFSTDLYGLGTTLLFLLTQKCPTELPQRQLKIDFRSQIKTSLDFADWLDKILEPRIRDRFVDANTALQVLIGKLSPKPKIPQSTLITISESNSQLIIDIPQGNTNYYNLLFLIIYPILLAAFLMAIWLILIYYVNFYILSLIPPFLFVLLMFVKNPKYFFPQSFIGYTIKLPLGLFVLYIISFILLTNLASYSAPYASLLFASITICISIYTVINFVSSKTLTVDEKYISIRHSLIKLRWSKEINLKKKKYLKALKFLTKPEKVWLEWEINRFLQKNK